MTNVDLAYPISSPRGSDPTAPLPVPESGPTAIARLADQVRQAVHVQSERRGALTEAELFAAYRNTPQEE